MPVVNPFAFNSPEGEAWQLGFQAGFTHPELKGGPPFQTNLLVAYQEGADTGRSARHDGRADDEPWLDPELFLEGQELGIDVLVHLIGDAAAGAAGGLAAVIVKVIQTPGDVELKPLDETFSASALQDPAKYVAVCLRKDHPLVEIGTNDDGRWAGSARASFLDAFRDMTRHEHPEAGVTRCSLEEKTCGIVWIAKHS